MSDMTEKANARHKNITLQMYREAYMYDVLALVDELFSLLLLLVSLIFIVSLKCKCAKCVGVYCLLL